eukprot:TRINITY_DN2911_c0_g1_i3.p1 TRINITY_DN2911_c0_g1~~TRINITY_DN2911_c0_g1_i3.p1  ORF type:complete len:214 (-),score=50.53 TRINITY_DN2911_c0_g1_i3:230-871(-)
MGCCASSEPSSLPPCSNRCGRQSDPRLNGLCPSCYNYRGPQTHQPGSGPPALNPAYTASQPGYSQPQTNNYAQPQPGYAQPQPGYAQPQPGYAQPQPGFAQPQANNYTKPQMVYQPPPPQPQFAPALPVAQPMYTCYCPNCRGICQVPPTVIGVIACPFCRNMFDPRAPNIIIVDNSYVGTDIAIAGLVGGVMLASAMDVGYADGGFDGGFFD